MDRDALLFPDGSFAAPLHVAYIEDVPESHRDWYQPFKAGRKAFRLRPDIAKVREPFDNAAGELQRQLDELASSQAARFQRLETRIRDMQVKDALTSALKDAGATEKLIPAAIALLTQSHRFDVEDGYEGEAVVTASTDAGLHSASGVVEMFLESEDGTGFRKRKPVPADSYFTDLVAGLKQRR